MADPNDVALGEIDLFSNLRRIVAARFKVVDFPHQFERRVLAARYILYEAHEIALFLGRLRDNGWDLSLAQSDIGFQPALAAGEIVELALEWLRPKGNRNRPLQPDICNIRDDALKDHPVPAPWVQN